MTVYEGLIPIDAAAAAPSAHSPKNPYIHGARGLFSLFVFVFHVVNSGLPTFPFFAQGIVLDALRSLEYGVELFFVVSGFVITGSLTSRRSVTDFMKDRAIRILPVLWVTIAVLVMLGVLFHKSNVDLHSMSIVWVVPANLVMLPTVLPFPLIHPAAWSLSYEFLFYIVCTLLIVGRNNDAMRLANRVALIVGLGLVVVYPRGIFFFVGLAVLRLSERGGVAPRLTCVPMLWLVVFLASWEGVQFASTKHIQTYTLIAWVSDIRLVLVVVACVAAGLFFMGLVQGRGLLSRVLAHPLMQWLGTISYSFYLWHPLVMAIVKHAILSGVFVSSADESAQLVFLVASLPPSLLIAHLSQKTLERNAKTWIRATQNRFQRVKRVTPANV